MCFVSVCESFPWRAARQVGTEEEEEKRRELFNK